MKRFVLWFLPASAALFFVGCQSPLSLPSLPARFLDDPEFGADVKAADGKLLGVFGYSVSAPGTEGFPFESLKGRVHGISGTSDMWDGEAGKAFNQRAWKFAEEYNRWLILSGHIPKTPLKEQHL